MYETGYYATGYHQTGYYSRSGQNAALLSRTWYSLIWEVREMVADNEFGCYRYPDEMILNTLNRGLYELQRIRPDAYYDLFGSNFFNVPEVSEANWEDVFPLDLRFYDPLLYYTAGMLEIVEDDYIVDGRAAGKIERFRNQLLRV